MQYKFMMKPRFILLAALCLAMNSMGQTFTPLSLSGMNADCVYQQGENRSEQMPLDNGNWIYYSKDINQSGGLISSFNSTTYGVPYTLAAFDGPNVLRLTNAGSGYANGTLTFAEQPQAELLFLLGMSASGKRDITVTVNYTSGASEETTVNFHDWYGGREESAIWGFGRMDRTNGGYDGRLEFGLFEAIVQVDKNRKVKSISCKTSSGDGYSYIFAVTAASDYTFPNSGRLFMISDAHLDTQWDWDVKTTIEQYILNTLNDNFARMRSYPHYRFSFEGAQKYQWAKEYYPTQYAQLKTYVANGQWNPAGGSWDACETMVSSAESLLRNLLYGQTFYKREFGRKGGLDIMLPDCFGFSAALPTIAKHCGFIGFHTQKLSWGSAYDYNSLPAFGKWRGIDGSEIYCILKPGGYGDTFNENLAYSASMLSTIDNYEKEYGLRANFRYTGVGDRGGALNETSVAWLEKSVTSNGPVKVELVAPTEAFEFMAENDSGQYKVVDHELPMRTHGVGCYTSQTMMKYWNRRNEMTADAAERSAVAADWLETQTYPYEKLTEAWHRVIWHQFHDDLPGTCLPRAYGYSRNDEMLSLSDFMTTMTGSVAGVAKCMDTRVSHQPIVVYNPLSIDREDVVEADVEAATPWTSVRVTDANGVEVPAQLTRYIGGRQHFIFAAHVPSMGYATYDLQKNVPCTISAPEEFTITENTMENAKYRVTLDTTTGDIKSLYDKTLDKEMLSANLRLALMKCHSDFWPSWEIPYDATRNTPFYVNNNDRTLSISIAEDGPLRKAFRIERTRLGSTFVQYVQLTSAGSDERVDVENEVDWQSRGYLLKLEANLKAANNQANYDNSLGFISRGVSNEQYYEYCGHQWADQTTTNGSYGLSILNDCKYGWDKPNSSRLRLSLVYTPEVTDRYTYQGNQDLGLNQFRFSLFSHEGKVGEQTQWQSDRLNQPLKAFVTTSHEGDLGTQFSFAQVDNNKVAVRALKRAEDSDLYIIRFHELTGQPQQNVTVTFPTELLSADEVNGIEETLGSANAQGAKLTFDINGFGIKTFALKLKPAEKTIETEQIEPQTPVDLNYNADMISLDAKRNDGISAFSSLYPGELLTNTVTHEGIVFNIGPSASGRKNMLQCTGQTIELPAFDQAVNDSLTLHLLAFSTQVNGMDLELDIDGKTQTLRVGYFKGNIADGYGFYSTPIYRPENVGFIATHSHNFNSAKDVAYDFLYLFHYKVRIPKGSQTLKVPSQNRIFIAALTLEDGPAYPFTALIPADYMFPTPKDIVTEAIPGNDWLIPDAVSASGYANTNEAPIYATDGNSYTKWCDINSANKSIMYTFNEEVEVKQWEVLLGGIENQNYIASNMTLSYYDEEAKTFVEIEPVRGNKENHFVHNIEPVTAQRFRLNLEKPEQGTGNTARLYQLNLYGSLRPGSTGLKAILPALTDGYCPVYDLTGRKVGTAMSHGGQVTLPQLSPGIYIVAGRKILVRN